MQSVDFNCEQLLSDGYCIVPGVLDSKEISHILSTLDDLGQSESVRRRGGVFAVRNLLELLPELKRLAESPGLRNLVRPLLGEQAFPVRGILFDKTEGANWKVPWHQDVTIAVDGRVEVEGFGPWSMKADVVHVQPPASILEKMLSVRLHLDPCGEENGALKVVPQSHREGRLPETEATRRAAEGPVAVCAVDAGDAVLMRPLLLHASSAAESPKHRRVLHFDYASIDLPDGLRWAMG